MKNFKYIGKIKINTFKNKINLFDKRPHLGLPSWFKKWYKTIASGYYLHTKYSLV